MEDNNVTTEVKDEVIFTHNGEEADRVDITEYSTPDVTVSQSSGGGFKTAVGIVGAIAAAIGVGVVAYKKHKAKKRAEDETKWDRGNVEELKTESVTIDGEDFNIIDLK